jgi:hypothetical protein
MTQLLGSLMQKQGWGLYNTSLKVLREQVQCTQL